MGSIFLIASCFMLLLMYGWSTEYEAHKSEPDPESAPEADVRAERASDDRALMEAISNTHQLRSLDLASFGREKAVSIDRLSAFVGKHDRLLLVPKGQNVDAVSAEIDAALRLCRDGKHVNVLLRGPGLKFLPQRTAFQGSQVRFIDEYQASDPAFLERELAQPAKRDGGKLKILMYPSARPPSAVLDALLQVARDSDADNLVQFVLLHVLNADMLAIQAGWHSVDNWRSAWQAAGTSA
jgi:hypothetical protein